MEIYAAYYLRPVSGILIIEGRELSEALPSAYLPRAAGGGRCGLVPLGLRLAGGADKAAHDPRVLAVVVLLIYRHHLVGGIQHYIILVRVIILHFVPCKSGAGQQHQHGHCCKQRSFESFGKHRFLR